MSAEPSENAVLGAMTYQCLFATSLDRLRRAHHGNAEAVEALNALQQTLLQADKASPAFLYDFSNLLLADSRLEVNVQESYLRMQMNAANDDFELPHLAHIPEFKELSAMSISLRKILARVPEEMIDRQPFLETIKDIASTIKKVLDVINLIISKLPDSTQSVIEKRKREFVHYSKRFSNTLKDYFKLQNSEPVFVAANLLVFQLMCIIRTVRERVRVNRL